MKIFQSRFYDKCTCYDVRWFYISVKNISDLRVNRPVDDVEKDVRSRKDDPGVLVYGMCVNPDTAVGPGANMACHLVRLHGQFSQHPFSSHSILLWHSIVSCGVDIHFTVAVRHHARMNYATSTWQLQ